MITAGTLYRFRRNDLGAALERVPQQVRPRGLYRMDKSQIQGAVLRAAALPDVAAMVEAMAEKIENPHRAIRARGGGMTAAEARRLALEDAAAIADRLAGDDTRRALGANAAIVANQIATAIRALIPKPSQAQACQTPPQEPHR